MTGLNLTGLVFLLLFILIVSGTLNLEPFQTDVSVNKTYTRRVIYDTVPYGSSPLFYDYVLGSPYYSPLDYWLNPYFYYSWYYPSYSSTSYTTSSSPRSNKVIHHTRRSRHRR